MRKWKWLGFAAMAILMSMNLVSCSQENDAVLPEQPTEEYVTVNLGVTGEYLELSESPLRTRAEGELKDLIAIEVYSQTDEGYFNDDEILDYIETPYAAGLFSSLDDIKIKLLQGQKYKFIVGVAVNMWCNGNYCEGELHKCPLTMVDNEFQYSNDYSNYINNYGQVKGESFYGELSEFEPTENGDAEIAAKRISYGAHYIAEGLTEGILKIQVNTNNGSNLYSVEMSSENPDSEGIYTFSNKYAAWRGEKIMNDVTQDFEYVNYYTTKQLSIYWTKDDGSVTPLGSFDVTFKRNVKTTIQINVEESGLQNGIVITREEAAMTDDENKYVIEGGEITEVPVTQQ